MKIVTKEEFISWINSRPSDQKFEMVANFGYDPCGCLMVQYAKDTKDFVPKELGDNWGCGYRQWQEDSEDLKDDIDFAMFENDKSLFDILGFGHDEGLKNINTYGELQRILRLDEMSKPVIKN